MVKLPYRRYLCTFMSAKILCIDTSLEVCSVAIGDFSVEERGQNIHSSRLNLVIEKLMKRAGMNLHDIDAICIDKGPGSYTGLRIGVSTAKGLSYALDKALLSTNTLQTMAYYYKSVSGLAENILLCPMIDARRMEVYYSLFDSNLNSIEETKAAVIDENFLAEYLSDKKAIFIGNGADKCKQALSNNENAMFTETDIYPSAKAMLPLAESKFKNKEFEDVFSFEPFYLKDFYIAPGK